MDLEKIRKSSLKKARKLGYQIPDKLPLLDMRLTIRSKEETGRRMIAIKAVVACAFSQENIKQTKKWIEKEHISEFLTPSECLFIFDQKGDREKFELQIESLWMLAWCTSLVKEMNFGEYCGDFLSELMPSIANCDPATPFPGSLEMRPHNIIVEALDLAYCLNWSMINARINSQPPPGKVREYVIEYRRKALEWVVSEEDWDKVISG